MEGHLKKIVKSIYLLIFIFILSHKSISQNTKKKIVKLTDTSFTTKFDFFDFIDSVPGITKAKIEYLNKNEDGYRVDSLLWLANKVFQNEAMFAFGIFNNSVTFHNSKFKNGANFNLCTFNEDAIFQNAQFEPLSSLSDPGVKGLEPIQFNDVKFYKELNFISAKFYENLNLSTTSFGTKVDFSGTEFYGSINTLNITLPDTLLFVNTNIIKFPIDLSHAKVKSKSHKCLINLYMADISKVYINYENFKLYFPDSIKMHPTPLDNHYFKINFEDKCQVYLLLLKQFEDRGLTDSYKYLDIEYREMVYLHEGDKLLNFIQKHWWNYGYNKELILKNTLLIFFLFVLINYLVSIFKGYEYLHLNIYEIPNLLESINAKEVELKSKFQFQFYLFVYVIIYTSLTFFTFNLNLKSIKYKSLFGMLFIVFKFVLGLICLSYLANFVLSH
jgi:hypothetical protein